MCVLVSVSVIERLCGGCIWDCVILSIIFFFFKQKTAYEMRISDWSSDVCSSDLAFFDHLNHAKRSVALDLATPAGRKALGELVAEADVVIEASRPRALAQLGIDVDATLGSRRDQVWT